MDYTEKSLTKLFVKYNNCISPGYVNEEVKNNLKRDAFNLSIKPRIINASLNISNSNAGWEIKSDNETTFAFGVEAEIVLPYNKNKWAIVMEPAYQYFKSQHSTPNNNISGGILNADVDYKLVEIPIGLRHYFFLNKNSKIFVNLSYTLNLSLNSTVVITRNDNSVFTDLAVGNKSNFNFGVGYKYSKYSLELRGATNRNIISDYDNFTADYKMFSIVLGYTIF